MHPALRESGGWFEEGCAWAKVAFAFPECFTDEQQEAAIRTLKDWCPDEYEAVTGKTLAPGDSHIKDQRLFYEHHAQDWVVISAIRSDQHPGMVECIATLGGKRGEWGRFGLERHRYLVPDAEYDRRGKFGFVIDPDRHALRDGPSSFLTGRAGVMIPDHIRANFQTLMRAAENGYMALMECADAESGALRYVICAVGCDGDEYLFTPFGHQAEGNPYEAYRPPE